MRLHSRRLQKILDENKDADRTDGDQLMIYHIFQTKRRRAERTVYFLRDGTGQLHTTPSGMAQSLTTFVRNMYDTIEVNDVGVEKLMEVVRCERHTSYEGNSRVAIRANGNIPNHTSGRAEKGTWERWTRPRILFTQLGNERDDLHEVTNQMFWARNISQQQKRGVIVGLPKAQGNQTPKDYRPITILNSDYKILARIIAQRLRPVLADHLTESQFDGVPGNTIIDGM